jgi:hypothetical protein
MIPKTPVAMPMLAGNDHDAHTSKDISRFGGPIHENVVLQGSYSALATKQSISVRCELALRHVKAIIDHQIS